jgi:hypothetical protein
MYWGCRIALLGNCWLAVSFPTPDGRAVGRRDLSKPLGGGSYSHARKNLLPPQKIDITPTLSVGV